MSDSDSARVSVIVVNYNSGVNNFTNRVREAFRYLFGDFFT